MTRDEFDWTEAAELRLATLWQQGLSTAEIGRQMDISKNAVVGKSRRMGLERRDSPIRRRADGVARPKPVRRVRDKPTLPPLPTAPAALAMAVRPVIAAPPPRPAEPVRLARGGALCCWPMGEPRTPGFRYCDAPDVVAGRSYCAEHLGLAYVKQAPRTGEPGVFVMSNWGGGRG